MAQAITFQSGSPLIGSPMVFSVTPSAHSSNYTFHRVTLRVYAGLETDADYTTFDFSTPVTSATPVIFDISSALRAVAEKYEYPVEPPVRYPYVKFRLEAWDEWMVDGTLYPEQNKVYNPAAPVTISGVSTYCYYYAFMGSHTDLERLTALSDTANPMSQWTRKPFTASPEVVYRGLHFILPKYFVTNLRGDSIDYTDPANPVFVSGAPTDNDGPKSTAYLVGTDTISSLANVYIADAPRDAYEIRFINGFGCEESVHVTCLRSSEVTIQTDRYALARQETFRQFSRSLAVKSNNREQWKMSTAPLDRAWQQWYIHEFLLTEQAWIKVNGRHLPIHILPEETTKAADCTKADRLAVEFTIEFDMNGSPY